MAKRVYKSSSKTQFNLSGLNSTNGKLKHPNLSHDYINAFVFFLVTLRISFSLLNILVVEIHL